MPRGSGNVARRVAEAVERAREAAREGAKDLADQIQANAPVLTGALRDSVTTENTATGADVIVGEGPVDYAQYVEDNEPFIAPVIDRARREIVEDATDAVRHGGGR